MRTTMDLTETQRAALERQARRRRVGMARLIRAGPVSERVEALLAEHLRRASPR